MPQCPKESISTSFRVGCDVVFSEDTPSTQHAESPRKTQLDKRDVLKIALGKVRKLMKGLIIHVWKCCSILSMHDMFALMYVEPVPIRLIHFVEKIPHFIQHSSGCNPRLSHQ